MSTTEKDVLDSLKTRHIDTIISNFRVRHKIEILYVRPTGTYQASIRGKGSERDTTKEKAIRKLAWKYRLEGWQYL